jgi:hypothetical protein
MVQRGWSLDQKKAILKEINVTGTMMDVCHRHKITPSYIYRWRKALCMSPMRLSNVSLSIDGKPVDIDTNMAAIIRRLVA